MSILSLTITWFKKSCIWSGVFIVIFSYQSLFAQTLDVFRTWTTIIKDSVIVQDSSYIIPGSIRAMGVDGVPRTIGFQVLGKKLILYQPPGFADSVKIYYQVLSQDPDIRSQTLDSISMSHSPSLLAMSYKFPPSNAQPEKDRDDQVEYAGAFGRGISFGNNQNLVLNSNLNLQLSGKLGNEIEINAAISDENLPLQADGNTQQLNEIDKIFVEIKRKNQTLLAGDQQIAPDNTYFLRYLKKYKGLQYSTINTLNNGGTLATQAYATIARGNFKRQVLEIQEGNQGPYRLTGVANELFVIVLSASEKVYLDGLLLTRGLEQDYVIDYNRSEISFTSKKIINRNSRVVVEFEYSNQSYLKSALGLQSRYQKNNFSVQWNTYREQDNKTSNIIQDLSSEDKLILHTAGDQLENLNRPSFRLNTGSFESDQLQYNLIDTSVGQKLYQNILILSTSGSNLKYTAQFTFLGPGRGNYMPETQLFTNGRAYKWVAPDPITLEKNGEYEPVTTLVAPKQQTQHSIQVEYKTNHGFFTKSEISLSDLDLNLFSPKDQQDNIGLAWKQELGYHTKFNKDRMTWNNTIAVEKLNDQFNYFEPFRNPEFNRNWSINTTTTGKSNELLWTGHSQIKNEFMDVGYTLQHFDRGSIYSGTQHGWNGQFQFKGTVLKTYGTMLSQSQSTIKGLFSRPRLEITQQLNLKGHHKVGINMESEVNKQHDESNLQLLPESFSYSQIKSFITGTFDRSKMSYQLAHTSRIDKRMKDTQLENYFRSEEWQLEHQWQLGKNTQWTFTATNRKIEFDQIRNDASDRNSNSLILRQSFNTRLKNDLMRLSQTLESGSGQEPSLEYTYIRVNKGQGYYTWIDINSDSVLQVSEFTLAPFQDQGEYIRFAVSNNNFVKTKNHLFLQHIELDGSKWRPTSKQSNWWKRFALTSNMNISWKQLGDQSFKLPGDGDSSLVGLQAQIRNQIFFNRGKPGFEIQTGQVLNKIKQRLNTGYESRTTTEYFIRTRQRIHSRIGLESYIAQIHQSTSLEFFALRNYDLLSTVLEPRIQFQSKASFNIATSYRYKKSINRLGEERANIHELKLETLIQPIPKWSIRSSFSIVQIGYHGDKNPWLEYSMLQGLRPGNNILLNLNIDREINANTLLRLGYDARQSTGGRYIQTGRAQVIASF